MKIVALILGLGLLAFSQIACIGCTNIEPGHVGVEIHKCAGGGVVDIPLDVGYHWYGACTDIVEYPTFQQSMILTKDLHEGSTTDDAIDVTSSEGLPISVDVAFNYTIDGSKVPGIYKKYRKDLEHIQSTYLRQAIREAMQETFSKYTAQQLYSDKREIARGEIQVLLTKKLATDGFNVTQFVLNKTRVPDAVTNAINGKVAMTQEAQKSEQEVRKIQAQAAQTVAKAEGDAKAMRLRADAEAYYNLQVSKSLTPAYVQYLNAKKWDGKLPSVTGSAVPFINMKD